ncbi:uncharacterized protein A1O9_11443 [Exophiala aquamarina CBS 119918]|uniref:Uncharacterized protein n=1 Tax=Exophiala aquamarina CBS 119918 TaxID=1182545 RepID=A0A072PAI5_9EURO|nr:uncharacterized protein A1O9_11443 [Exophiala aquamarina CBS 119918]KEF52600.1 hypothetical protein A1O9_11443 [Exophiala aquamarina CBS 119918]
MSLKRKASALEEPVTDHATNRNPTAASSSSPSSSLSSVSPTSSLSSFSTSSSEHIGYRDAWHVGYVPYLNSRTLKRYRDNRPAQDQIHDHTLKKLYEAQRLHLDEAMPLSEALPEEEVSVEDIEMDDVPVVCSGTDSLKQKTLESFFNIQPNTVAG